MKEVNQQTREQLALRIGAVCLIGGSVFVVGARLAHGDLPADKGPAAALSYVVTSPMYPLVHFVDTLGFLIFAGGLVLLANATTRHLAWVIARLGIVSVLVGVAVHIVDFSADGFGLPMLARAWAHSSSGEQANLELAARALLAVIGGPSVVSLVFVWGTTLVLYALAVMWEGYPGWLAWTGVILGLVIFGMGTVFYLSPNIFPGALFYGGAMLLAHLWTAVLAVIMWRRASPVAVE